MRIWIYWGLNSKEGQSLLAVFTHHPTINETDVFAKRYPHYDYILQEFETVSGGSEENGTLYEKLKKLLPPEPEDKTATWGNKINFKPDSIRYGTDAFSSYLGGETPRNDRELRDVLYVFGKFMFKEMDRQAEYWRKVATDALYLDTRPIFVDKENTCLTPKK